jgi:hypothetical protein
MKFEDKPVIFKNTHCFRAVFPKYPLSEVKAHLAGYQGFYCDEAEKIMFDHRGGSVQDMIFGDFYDELDFFRDKPFPNTIFKDPSTDGLPVDAVPTECNILYGYSPTVIPLQEFPPDTVEKMVNEYGMRIYRIPVSFLFVGRSRYQCAYHSVRDINSDNKPTDITQQVMKHILVTQ